MSKAIVARVVAAWVATAMLVTLLLIMLNLIYAGFEIYTEADAEAFFNMDSFLALVAANFGIALILGLFEGFKTTYMLKNEKKGFSFQILSTVIILFLTQTPLFLMNVYYFPGWIDHLGFFGVLFHTLLLCLTGFSSGICWWFLVVKPLRQQRLSQGDIIPVV